MNNVILTGNLASDPEGRTTQSGVTNATFRIAVRRDYKNADGKHDSDFFPVIAWRASADYVTKYLRKGSKVAVEGTLQTRSYTAQDGSKRYVTEIIADRVEGLDRPGMQDKGGDELVEVDDDPELPF